MSEMRDDRAAAPLLRLAVPEDRPALTALIDRSVRGLSPGHYSPTQIDAALSAIFGIDSTLIADGTYFVVEIDGKLAGCGGWSRREALFGGDQLGGRSPRLLDPAREAAKIRALFVDPAFARRGVASLLMQAATAAAQAAGFTALELMATLPGVPLYAALGFTATGRVDQPLPGGTSLPLVPMRKLLV